MIVPGPAPGDIIKKLVEFFGNPPAFRVCQAIGIQGFLEFRVSSNRVMVLLTGQVVSAMSFIL